MADDLEDVRDEFREELSNRELRAIVDDIEWSHTHYGYIVTVDGERVLVPYVDVVMLEVADMDRAPLPLAVAAIRHGEERERRRLARSKRTEPQPITPPPAPQRPGILARIRARLARRRLPRAVARVRSVQ